MNPHVEPVPSTAKSFDGPRRSKDRPAIGKESAIAWRSLRVRFRGLVQPSLLRLLVPGRRGSLCPDLQLMDRHTATA